MSRRFENNNKTANSKCCFLVVASSRSVILNTKSCLDVSDHGKRKSRRTITLDRLSISTNQKFLKIPNQVALANWGPVHRLWVTDRLNRVWTSGLENIRGINADFQRKKTIYSCSSKMLEYSYKIKAILQLYVIFVSLEKQAKSTFSITESGILSTLRPRQKCPKFGKWHFKINIHSSKRVPWNLINNKSVLVQVMAWRQTGDKPSFEPMMPICVTGLQWLKQLVPCTGIHIHIYVIREITEMFVSLY